jgi:hypothetical protein
MKNVFFLLVICTIILAGSSCVNKKVETATNKITVKQFLDSAEKWSGKDITISGTVSHVCREGGEKLFIFDEDPNAKVRINIGANMSPFDVKLEGSTVEFAGTVVEFMRYTNEVLDNMAAEIKKTAEDGEKRVCNEENKAVVAQNKDNAKASEATNDPYADVNALRKKLADSGKDHISFWVIECKSFKEIKK